jgi:hypothetical protein
MTQGFAVELEKASAVGQNVRVLEVDGLLVLVIDPSVSIGPSSSGKMIGVASTGGFAVLPNGMKMNLYLGKRVK